MQSQVAKTFASDSQSIWHFEPSHTTVEFSIRNLFFFTVTGRLTVLLGAILLDEADIIRSAVRATISAASVDTRLKRRDAHLRSADFLAAERHPNVEFQSSKVGPGKDRDTLAISGSPDAAGNFTLNGLPAEALGTLSAGTGGDSEGFLPARLSDVRAGTDGIELRLRRGVVIEGEVELPQGASTTGRIVTAEPLAGASPERPARSRTLEWKTGRFRIYR